jgi:hypothetical protein
MEKLRGRLAYAYLETVAAAMAGAALRRKIRTPPIAAKVEPINTPDFYLVNQVS